MSGQIQIDLDELDRFIDTLKQFNARYEDNVNQLVARWQSLLDSWNDPECAKFLDAEGWLQVDLELRRYLSQMSSYSFWLQKKAEPLTAYRAGTSAPTPPAPSPTPPMRPQPRPVERPELGGGSPEIKIS
ncbi:MAG TPA: hypothetical protein VFD70_27075 [Anaerolineae bacterium]|nr:hypothetical protein [Anaerolineae bacterium]